MQKPRSATFIDCNFQFARLQESIFRGAHLGWSKEPPQEMGDWIDVGYGEMQFGQTYWPPFHEADLSGVSFEDVSFENADFREALNILECSFAGATGLNTCLFDDDVKEQVLRQAESGHD